MSFNFGICGWSKFFICSFVLAINSHSKSALKKEKKFVPSVCQISSWLIYGTCSHLCQLLQLPATKNLFQYTNINMTLIRYLRNQESGQKKYHLPAEPRHFGWALVLVDMCGRDIYHQLEISTFCDREWRQESFHSRNKRKGNLSLVENHHLTSSCNFWLLLRGEANFLSNSSLSHSFTFCGNTNIVTSSLLS